MSQPKSVRFNGMNTHNNHTIDWVFETANEWHICTIVRFDYDWIRRSIVEIDRPSTLILMCTHAHTHSSRAVCCFFLSLPIFLWLPTSSSSLHKLIVISIQNIPISIQSVIIFFFIGTTRARAATNTSMLTHGHCSCSGALSVDWRHTERESARAHHTAKLNEKSTNTHKDTPANGNNLEKNDD